MRLIFCLLITIIFGSKTTLFSQANFQWADDFRCSLGDMAIDGNKNIYTCGLVNTLSDFDPGPGTYTSNTSGAYLLKLNQNGDLLSVKLFTCSYSCGAQSVALDNNGNIYLACFLYHSVADFDPGPASFTYSAMNTQDAVLVKLDSAGNFVWAKQIAGSWYTTPTELSIDGNGNLILTGSFWGTTDFDPSSSTYTLTTNNSTQGFVASYDTNGAFLWAEEFSGSGGCTINGSLIDNQGNIVLTGCFSGTIDFDPSNAADSLTSDSLDIFVCKLNSSGNLIYAKGYGGSGNQYVSAIAADPNSGDICLTGYFLGSQDFDPNNGNYMLNSSGATDIYVTKLSSSGNFLWAKKMGGTGNDQGASVNCDLNGNILTTGHFNSIANFNAAVPSYTFLSHGLDDVYFNMLDPQGNVLWTQTVGSPCYEEGTFLLPVGASTLFVAGNFGCTTNFNFNGGTYTLTGQSANYSDVFITKITYTPNGISELKGSSGELLLFPNPTNSKFTIACDCNYESAELSIFKSDGTLLRNYVVNRNSIEVDFSNYPKGNYFFRLNTGTGAIKTGKIIKD